MSKVRETLRARSAPLNLLLVLVVVVLIYLIVVTSISALLFGRTPTQGEIVTYWALAGSAMLLCVVGLVVGILAGRPFPAISFVVLGVFVTLGTLVFSVPQINWQALRQAPPISDDYVPCYSGSNDCPGG